MMLAQPDLFEPPRARRTDPDTSHAAAAQAEVWRPIPGLSRYSVSSLGRVRRDARIYRCQPGILKQHRNQHGHKIVAVVLDDGRYQTKTVHSLVASAFLGRRPEGFVTRHLNGDGSDNRPENLSYGTHKDNAADAIAHGTQVRGSRQHLAVLTEMQVRRLKLMRIEQGVSMDRLAVLFEVHKSTVFDILKGRTWGHVEPVGDIRHSRGAIDDGERKTSSGRAERLWRLTSNA